MFTWNVRRAADIEKEIKNARGKKKRGVLFYVIVITEQAELKREHAAAAWRWRDNKPSAGLSTRLHTRCPQVTFEPLAAMWMLRRWRNNIDGIYDFITAVSPPLLSARSYFCPALKAAEINIYWCCCVCREAVASGPRRTTEGKWEESRRGTSPRSLIINGNVKKLRRICY